MKKLVLLDGYSILFRAFYGMPPLTTASGLHTNAVYGFLNIMFKVLEEEQPDGLIAAFDAGGPTFRHEFFDAYKGTRKPMPEEMREQVPVMEDILAAMHIPVIKVPGLEADDILGTIGKAAVKKDIDVCIVSGDRDLLQLAEDRLKIRLAKPRQGRTESEIYDAAKVREVYQVTPAQIIELKALMGDASDNIPGLPGVGEKTATKLLLQYGSIENVWEHREELKPPKVKKAVEEHFDLARLSKRLATIEVNGQFDYDLDQAAMGSLYTPEAYELFKKLGFKQFISRFEQQEKPAEELRYSVVQTEEQAEELCDMIRRGSWAGVAFYGQPVIGMAVTLENGTYTLLEQPAEPVQMSLFGEEDTGREQNGFVKQVTEACLSARCAMFHVKDWLHATATVETADLSRYFDISLGAYLINPLTSQYTYDDIAGDCLGASLPSLKEIMGKVKWTDGVQAPEQVQHVLALESWTAYNCREKILGRLRDVKMDKLFTDLEMPLIQVLASMEEQGLGVDRTALKEYGEALAGRMDELEQIIYDLAGEKFNIQSPKQLGTILFEKLKLPGGKKTKSGFSTAADVLQKLEPDHEIVARILEYRTLSKLKSTYADGLYGCIGREDGRIHSTFHQTITATGRISSAEPNLQNIPVRMELGRQIRRVFVPRKDCIYVDADYSQIELRVLAHMSGDPNMLEAFENHADIHRTTASLVFHTPYDQVTKHQRRSAKAVNFGIVYGISAFGLAQDLNISRKEAEEYIEKYFATYPRIKAFLDTLVKDTKDSGYSYTMFGRRRPVPEISSSNFMQRSFGERIAMNSPIQGSAADIIKMAMLAVYRRLKAEGCRAKMVLQVHDELLIETPAEEKEQVERILKEEMERVVPQMKVKLEADMSSGTNWYETK